MTDTVYDLATCELCGRQALDVSLAIIRRDEPVRENEYYERILRCKDHEACAARAPKEPR